MKPLDHTLAVVDRAQRSHRAAALAYGVAKKFGDDSLNQFVIGLGWYGFVCIYPLLLVVITIFGYIGVASLGHHLVSTLHQFPVVGQEFNPESRSNNLHGSAVGLVIGLIGMLYGAQGVTQTAQQAMMRVWNIPQLDAPGFASRLSRSLTGLLTIGGAFVLQCCHGHPSHKLWVGLSGTYSGIARHAGGEWRLISPRIPPPHASSPLPLRTYSLVPSLPAPGSRSLITLGAGLVQHQVKHSSEVYGQFGIVIGLVGFLFLLAKISLYSAELNPVLARRLWPRAVQNSNPTVADNQVLHDIVHESLRRRDQRVGVGFGDHAADEARRDVVRTDMAAESERAGSTTGD